MSPHDLAAAFLRRLEPERAHGLTVAALKAGVGPRDHAHDPLLATTLAGLSLPNPIGLAAGFDKNGEVPAAMLAAGFGFVEVGTVTPLAQSGNPGPRLFRLAEDGAVINRLGFNNAGHDALARNLPQARGGVVGVNVGANKESSDRIADYVAGVTRFAPLADYLTINVSSPNTPGLRDLQGRDALGELLGRCTEAMTASPTPLFLKVAPDLDDRQTAEIAETAAPFVGGLIVSNTTLDRPETLRSVHATQSGGLSGAPLFERSTAVLAAFRAALPPQVALIGVGGVATAEDVLAKLRAGASAVQLYTALVYEGPGLIRRLKHDLAARCRAEGASALSELVGR